MEEQHIMCSGATDKGLRGVLQVWSGPMPMPHTYDMLDVQKWSTRHGLQYTLIADADHTHGTGRWIPLSRYMATSVHLSDYSPIAQYLRAASERVARIVTSDLVRLLFLTDNPRTAYFDCDCVPVGDGLHCIGYDGCSSYGAALDNHLLVSKTAAVWRRYFDAVVNRILRLRRVDVVDQHVVLNNRPTVDDVARIPNSMYRHGGAA